MTVEVIVPWRPGCPHRQRAWDWVRTAHEGNWPVTEAPGPAPWCKAAAVTPAVEASNADIIVIADADVWCDDIPRHVAKVAQCGWVIPHRDVYRLTEAGTDEFVSHGKTDGHDTPYLGIPGGGIVIIERALYLEVPLDPRFVGWGGEDQAWGYALRTLAGKPPRGRAPLIHLWHPPQDRKNRRVGSDANERLRRRYQARRSNPKKMRQLIEEVTRGSRTADHH